MKSVKFMGVALLALSLAACGMLGLQDGADNPPGESQVELPPDAVNDVARTSSGEFTFETFVAVDLDLDISVLPLPEADLRRSEADFALP